MNIRIRKLIPIIPSSSSLSAVTSAAAAPLLQWGRGRASAGAARRRSWGHRADALSAAIGKPLYGESAKVFFLGCVTRIWEQEASHAI